MDRNIIWVTGASASGKTSVINYLREHFPEGHIFSDAKEMLLLNNEDTNHQHHIHPGGGEGFFLTSSHHFDESIRRIADRITVLDPNKIAIIEIARGQGDKKDIDLSYRRFLQLVPTDIFDRSLVLYTQSSWETRSRRNMGRRTNLYAKNVERESFYVPASAMESFFRTDDFELVKELFPCPTFTVVNENVSKEELKKQIHNFVQAML